MKKTKLTVQERDIIGRALCQIDKKIKYRPVSSFSDLYLADNIYFLERSSFGNFQYVRKDLKIGETFLHKHIYVIVDEIRITADNFEEEKYRIYIEEELDWEDIYALVIQNWEKDNRIFKTKNEEKNEI